MYICCCCILLLFVLPLMVNKVVYIFWANEPLWWTQIVEQFSSSFPEVLWVWHTICKQISACSRLINAHAVIVAVSVVSANPSSDTRGAERPQKPGCRSRLSAAGGWLWTMEAPRVKESRTTWMIRVKWLLRRAWTPSLYLLRSTRRFNAATSDNWLTAFTTFTMYDCCLLLHFLVTLLLLTSVVISYYDIHLS